MHLMAYMMMPFNKVKILIFPTVAASKGVKTFYNPLNIV